MATAQNLNDKVAVFTAATTLLADLETVGNSVRISSLATTASTAATVFDFAIVDAAGGSTTSIDELTISVVFSGLDFEDVAGVVVSTSGRFSGDSETSGGDNTLTSGADAGLELQRVAGGMDILLGGATAAVNTEADGVAELISVADGTAIDLTVSVFLSAAPGALQDGGAMTFNLGSSDFVVDAPTSDAVVPAQRITPGSATIEVKATKLAFVQPVATRLATDGLSIR